MLWAVLCLFILCCCCCCLKAEIRWRKSRSAIMHRRGAGGSSDDLWQADDRGALTSASGETDDEGGGDAIWPAYSDGWPVEFFSSQHGQWLAADLHTKLARGTVSVRHSNDPADDEEHPPEVIYAATLRNQSMRTTKASLEVLRVPLQPDDPCEIFMASLKRWVPGEVGPDRRLNGIHILYSIRPAKSDVTKQLPASALRRRYDPGANVEAYCGASKGWMPATVAAGPQRPAPEGQSARLYWSQVPILIKSGEDEEEREDIVSSCLLRPAGSAAVGPMRQRGGMLAQDNSNRGPESASGGTEPSTNTSRETKQGPYAASKGTP